MQAHIKERINKIHNGEVPEGYQKTKNGIIPKEWKTKIFDEISQITRLAGYEYSEYWEEKADGEIIALRGFNIGQNKIIDKNFARISDELSLKLKRSRLYKGDVVYPCVGTIGDAVVIEEDDKYHIQQNIAKITCNSECNPYFLVQFLISSKGMREVSRFNATSSQPNVLVGSLRRFRISLPPLPEQQKIAEILSTWDDAIRLRQQLIEQKKAQKKGLMQLLLTGKIRVTEMGRLSSEDIEKRVAEIQQDIVPEGYQKTKVGIIPGDWEAKKIGNLVGKFVNGGTPSTQVADYWKGEIPWITGADILNQKVGEIRRYITKEAVENSSTHVIEKGNLLLVSRTGVGKLAIAPFDIAISQDFTGIYTIVKRSIDGSKCLSPSSRRCRRKILLFRNIFCPIYAAPHYNKEELSTDYLFSYFDYAQSQLKSQNQGTSIKGITREALSSIRIHLPPLTEQQKIAEILSTADKVIELLGTELEHLNTQKKGLMQLLLTGKIRVHKHL